MSFFQQLSLQNRALFINYVHAHCWNTSPGQKISPLRFVESKFQVPFRCVTQCTNSTEMMLNKNTLRFTALIVCNPLFGAFAMLSFLTMDLGRRIDVWSVRLGGAQWEAEWGFAGNLRLELENDMSERRFQHSWLMLCLKKILWQFFLSFITSASYAETCVLLCRFILKLLWIYF